MRIGYYQYHPEFGAPKRNLEKVEDSLAGVEADIIVLPELAFTGYFFEDRDELRQLAEEVSDSPTVRGLSRLCRKKSFYLVAGFAERYQKRRRYTCPRTGMSGQKSDYLCHRCRYAGAYAVCGGIFNEIKTEYMNANNRK